MDYYIVDRFEGALALCETPGGVMEKLPRESLPPDAAEGDLLFWEEGRWRVDRQATENRRAALAAKRGRLRKKDE